ncbi:MAG: hypothetical protein WA988_09240 [Candidatus Nanopelagicales bacterium]
MRNKVSSFGVGVLASIVLSTSAMVVGAGTASATPTNCSYNKYATSARAYCSGGSGGAYQVYAQCKNAYWPFGWVFVEGPWRNAGSGQYSSVMCPWLHETMSAGVGLRR